jgi:hypothetical protein
MARTTKPEAGVIKRELMSTRAQQYAKGKAAHSASSLNHSSTRPLARIGSCYPITH